MVDKSKVIIEKIDFLHREYEDDLDKLHPIDHMLAIAEPFIGLKWLYLIKQVGITYETPCVFLSSDDEWAEYSNFGESTVLIVSRQSYKLMSKGVQLAEDGIVAVDNDIYKDKKRINHAMLCFDHSITKSEFLEKVIGKV